MANSGPPLRPNNRREFVALTVKAIGLLAFL